MNLFCSSPFCISCEHFYTKAVGDKYEVWLHVAKIHFDCVLDLDATGLTGTNNQRGYFYQGGDDHEFDVDHNHVLLT